MCSANAKIANTRARSGPTLSVDSENFVARVKRKTQETSIIFAHRLSQSYPTSAPISDRLEKKSGKVRRGETHSSRDVPRDDTRNGVSVFVAEISAAFETLRFDDDDGNRRTRTRTRFALVRTRRILGAEARNPRTARYRGTVFSFFLLSVRTFVRASVLFRDNIAQP